MIIKPWQLLLMGPVFTGVMLAEAEVKLAVKETLLDNDQVLVVKATYAPGAQSGIHTHIHPHRVAYFEKGGSLSLVTPEGKATDLTVAAGKTLFLPAATHNVINLGNSEVILVETELKD